MQGQMAGDLISEMGIGLFHPVDCLIQSWITTRLAFFEVTNLLNPSPQPFRRRIMNVMSRRWPQPFDRNHFFDTVGEYSGINQGDDSTQTVADQIDRIIFNYIGES